MVECQLDPLRHCPKSKYDLDKCLKELPQSLDETCERMPVSVDAHCQERAQRILTLLCFSSRPLSVMEILEAIAVDIHDLQRYDSDRRLENSEDLLRICPGLIDIQAKQPGDQNEMVRIAHFSVQEYLLSDRIKCGRAASFAMSSARGHLQISKACLIYLCNEDFLSQTLTPDCVDQFPLASFAAQFWHHHCTHPDVDAVAELETWIQILLSVKRNFDRWIRVYDVDQDWWPWERGILYDKDDIQPASAIYYTALLGLDSVLTSFMSSPQADLTAQGGYYGNALQAASAGGHEKVVEILLKEGMDVNAQGGEYGNALQAASKGGHERVVQILLKEEADVNTQGNVLEAASAHNKRLGSEISQGRNTGISQSDRRHVPAVVWKEWHCL